LELNTPINEGKPVVKRKEIEQQIENKNQDDYDYINSEMKAVEVQKVQKNTYEYVNSNSNNLNKVNITNYHINDNSDDEKFFESMEELHGLQQK
jgi:hypothetical protein